MYKGKRTGLTQMGMAATQANLLTLTNRKNTIGYNLSMLSAQKMSLARESDAISTRYNEALNEKVLKWSNDAGATYHDLTYNTLMNPSALNNYEPYMLTDMSGKVVVDDRYKKYAEMVSPDGAPGGNYESKRAEILSGLTGIPVDDLNKVESNNEDIKNLDKEIAEHLGEEPEIEQITADAAFQNLGKVSGDAKTDKTGSAGSNWDVTGETSWTDIINSIGGGGNYVTYLSYDGDGNSANAKFKRILESFADVISKATAGSVEITDAGLEDAVNKTYSLFTEKYAYDGAQKHDRRHYAGENAGNYNTICHQHDKKSNIFDGSHHSYAVSLTNMANVFLTYLLGDEESQSKITTTSCPGIDLSSIMITDGATQSAHDAWQEEYDSLISQRDELEESSSLLFDAEEEKLIDFYDAIFENIATNGWVYNEYINDTEYLNDILQTGVYNITKAERGSDGEWDYDESAATTCQNVYQVTDKNEQTKATAEYEKEKTRLERKEDAIDIRMKKLETEQSAINEMLESYRSMIDDNVDRTFDVFS